MNHPPKQIDNATVLEYAWSERPFGVVRYSDDSIAAYIHGLAICQYTDSNVIYRFSCTRDWETVQDMDYKTIEEAKRLLPEQYRNAPIIWHQVQSKGKAVHENRDET